MKILQDVGAFVLGLGVAFLISLVLALPVMWLWNWLCPELFGLPEIKFLQSWGLMVLFSILFGSSMPSQN